MRIALFRAILSNIRYNDFRLISTDIMLKEITAAILK